MTKNNYTQLSNELLIEQYNNLHIPVHYFNRHLDNEQVVQILEEIKQRTKFLDGNYEKIPVSMRLYCLTHSITSCPKCKNPNCSNNVTWNKHKAEFRTFCSCKCSATDETVNDKKKETCIKHFGVSNPMQSTEIQNKSKQTLFKNYQVYSPLQSIEIQKRYEETSIANHGYTHPLKSPEVRNAGKETCLLKFGVENPAQSDEIQQKWQTTNQERYGVKFAAQSQEIKDKTSATNMERHGVKWYPQSEEYHKKAHKPYINAKYPDMTFSSSWEFKVYDFFTEHKIQFEYQPTISFPYEYQGTHHTYHPDFKVDDKIIEVKGDNFFRINESSGEEEMFCPYRNKDWSDEKYEWMCGLYEAKHQCMICNHVIILREQNIKNLETDLV